MNINLPILPGPNLIKQAKLAGASYNIASKRFYIPAGNNINSYEGFIPLTCELVPVSTWYENVRSILKKHWPQIKKDTYKEYNYCCCICGGKGSQWPVEAHESWSYNIVKGVQKLIKIVALCPSCHQVKHIGLAGLNGQADIAMKRLRTINCWTVSEANAYVDDCFETWEKRSQVDWNIDISLLQKYGYKAS